MATTTEATPRTDVHPLEPLTPEEISAAAALLRDAPAFTATTRFVQVALKEPAKRVVLDGGDAPREAFAILYDKGASATYECVADLTGRSVTRYDRVAGVQPSLMLEEFLACEDLVRDDPQWQEAMRRRGVTDFSMAMIDPWAAGYTGPDDAATTRLARPLTFLRQGSPDDNGYARPVEGLVTVVDLDAMKVLKVEDTGVVAFPPQAGNYMPELMTREGNRPAHPALRDDVRPIEITQPEGPSFTVDGHAVSWQKWRLRIGYTPREGLVLHQVSYVDRGRERPVVYRASLSEMYIPYGDPAPTHRIKNVFDMGEYGVGFLLNPLQLGCDCLGEIRYFDVVVNDQDGNPLTIPNAICMHEEDYGVGWKHTDFRTEKVEVRRSRRLVVSCFATVGNYEYGYFWYLYTDGTIEYEIKLSGVISTGAVEPGTRTEYGTLVAPGLYGPNHQHFFNVRLDMSVDGQRNSVHEVEAQAAPAGPDNPTGNAWRAHSTPLRRESDAKRLVSPLTARSWKISNPAVPNEMGDPVAFQLVPGDNVLPLQQEGSQAWARAQFAYTHLWVTPYAEDELYAAGNYPNQNPGGDGLPRWTQADRPVEDTDLVVWYTFGAHHVVRPEDWPVMPTSHVGFQIRPSGFFDGNPALDMPPSEAACHSTESAGAEGAREQVAP